MLMSKIANKSNSKGDSASLCICLISVCGSRNADLQNTLSFVSFAEVPTGPPSTWQKKLLSSITFTGEMTRVMSDSMVTRSVSGVSLSTPLSLPVEDLKATRCLMTADSYEREMESKREKEPI